MKKLKECIPRMDWFGIGLGITLMVVGTGLTLTWVGAIIGVPMFLAAIELFVNPKTLVGTPCAH